MVLSAFLKLDAAGFLSPMGRALEGTKFLTRALGDLSAKISTGFDFGAKMDNLSTQMGISAGRVAVLRQEFDDAGIGGDSLAGTIGAMRKALGGMSEDGEPTNAMFKRLGLSVDALKGMDAEGQFHTIGKAIQKIGDPLERANALTAVFGKSGAPLARIFADDGALEAAEKRLGGLPAIMDKNAAAFNDISTRVAALKTKTTGFWAGMAEGVLPMADGITRAFDGIDLSGLGQKVGETVSAIVEMFQSMPLGELLAKGVRVGGAEALAYMLEGVDTALQYIGKAITAGVEFFQANFDDILDYGMKAIEGLGKGFGRLFPDIMSTISAGIGKAIQTIMEWLGKIPKIGEWLGLDGFKADSFADLKQDAKDWYQDDGGREPEKPRALLQLADIVRDKAGGERADLLGAFNTAMENVRLRNEEIASGANAKPAWGDMKLATPGKKEKGAGGGGNDFLSDALARIGGMTGGLAGGNARKMEGIAERTARNTEELVRMGKNNLGGAPATAVFA